MRNIPVVPILNGKVVHTTRYWNPRYIGEPSVIVKQLSDMGADEIFLFDISHRKRSENLNRINFSLLEKIAEQAQCPLGYGGGLYENKHIDTAIQILRLGYEKIISASAWWRNGSFYEKLADKVGRQSVVKCIEHDEGDCPWTLEEIELETKGCGEILLVDTEKNGTSVGINPQLCDLARKCSIPTVVCGGYTGEKLDVDVAASTHYMLYQGQVMVNYEHNNVSTL